MKRTLAAAALAVLTMMGTVGCFADEAGTGKDGADRLKVGLAFGPRRQMSAFTDDAPIASRLGATETLLNLDRNGTFTPGLAESWSQVDARTTRLTLRRDVIFHDGTLMTVTHVVNALRRATAAKPVLKALVGVALTATAVGDDVPVGAVAPTPAGWGSRCRPTSGIPRTPTRSAPERGRTGLPPSGRQGPRWNGMTATGVAVPRWTVWTCGSCPTGQPASARCVPARYT